MHKPSPVGAVSNRASWRAPDPGDAQALPGRRGLQPRSELGEAQALPGGPSYCTCSKMTMSPGFHDCAMI